MLSFKVLLCALALTLLEIPVESLYGGGSGGRFGGGGGGGGGGFGGMGRPRTSNSELSGAELTELYNSCVVKAEKMKRPLEGTGSVLGPISHSGVRVTLENGDQWLIHKGRKFGTSTNMVVVNAQHMSSDWKVVETKEISGEVTVSDFVEAGGSEFSWWSKNCHKA